uniref:gastrin-releasing peptide isoform X1 n=1 Tax=Jaculus jaculus TaxID=51337 RepID=UPI00064CF65C|nr:gastrin-releasing peptide isoform X1 [Jaculus jaculus]
MRAPELPLFLLALVLCQAPRGPAAPVSAGGGTVLAKMYPRGNHWAVGHLMGKKSTGQTPHVEEGESPKQPLRESIPREEATRNFLGLLEIKGNKSHQPPYYWSLGRRQPAWDAEDNSYFKDVGSRSKGGRLSAPGPQGEGRN